MEVAQMAKSKIRSKAERTALIHDFLASGLQKTAWCKEKGIPYTTFCKWLASYKENQETVRFVALTEQSNDTTDKASHDATTDLLVEIGICKVHITEATPISLLTKLVKAVNNANV